MSLKVPSTASSWSTENKNNKNEKSRRKESSRGGSTSSRCKCE